MKNILRKCLSLLAPFLLVSSLSAASLDDLQVKNLESQEFTTFVKGSDTVMMTVFYL